jgi:probable HAF family extracellular repeat protein
MVRSLWFTAALAFALGSLPALAGPIYLAEQLLPLSGDIFVQARAINAVGQVVGYSRSPEGRNSAVLWDDGDVIDLSPGATMGLGYVANDINDVGQIVGAGYVCEPSCPEFVPIPLSAGSRVEGSGPEAWLTPDSTANVPILADCLLDDAEIMISNSGRTASVGGVSGVTAGDDACISWPMGLLEDGVAIIPEGYLWEEPADAPIRPGGIPNGFPTWVVVPSCVDASISPYSFYGHVPLDGRVRTDVCGLVASSYSRNRLENASGQFFINADGRAFLFTPMPEPGSLALVAIALCALVSTSRRETRPGATPSQYDGT